MPDETTQRATPREAWVNVTMPTETKRRFRRLCAEEDKSMSTKALELIEAELVAWDEAKR